MRRLRGTIKHFDDQPWINVSVYLTLINGTFNSVNQYPIDTQQKKTDENGEFIFNVIPNVGVEQSYYILTTPDRKKHAFTIPDGTSDIEFSVVRETGIIATDPEYTNVLNYLEDYIDDAIANIQASSVIAEVFSCGQTISALKAVRYDPVTGKVFYVSSSDETHLNKCVGVSSQSGVLNDNIQVVTSGYLTDQSWNWSVGSPIFFDSGGTLTHTPGSNYYQVIAIPVTNNKILISVEQPIKL